LQPDPGTVLPETRRKYPRKPRRKKRNSLKLLGWFNCVTVIVSAHVVRSMFAWCANIAFNFKAAVTFAGFIVI